MRKLPIMASLLLAAVTLIPATAEARPRPLRAAARLTARVITAPIRAAHRHRANRGQLPRRSCGC